MARIFLKPPDAALIERAERQDGLVRRSDLAAVGLSRNQVLHRVRTGRLHRIHPGVYAVGHRGISRRAEFLAAVWWCGGGAALSHESAAVFYGWIAEDQDAPGPIHVTTTRSVKGRPGVIVHRTRELAHRDAVVYDGLRVTDRVRTLIDLADHLTYAELRAVADELPSLPTQRLISAAERLPGRAASGRMHRLIHSEDAHARFAMERRYTRYCRAHGVPQPDGRNVRVAGVRVDCFYPRAGLVVELDSRAHHTRRKEMAADRRRDRLLKREGVDVLRLVWEDLAPDDPLAAGDVILRLGLTGG